MEINININIANIIGDIYAIEAAEGQKVFSLISKAFAEKRTVILSFLNIEMLTTAFLNTAIGQLYKDFSEEFIRENLKVENMTESGKIMLKRVVDTAKLRYNDPDFYKKLQQSVDEILEQ